MNNKVLERENNLLKVKLLKRKGFSFLLFVLVLLALGSFEYSFGQHMPTTGNVKILAILIEFKGSSHINTQQIIHNRLFGNGDPSEMPYESLTKYYERSSYRKLDLSQGNTLDWYTVKSGFPDYEGFAWESISKISEEIIKEALKYHKNQGHDFNQYDGNGDGNIDYLIVVAAGSNENAGGFSSFRTQDFLDSQFKINDVGLSKYVWIWEESDSRKTSANMVQLAIHETGHMLGLPDYYDSSRVGPDGGVGGFDVMASNNWDHNCFSKWKIGWITPTVVSSGTQNLTLRASGQWEDCIVIWPEFELDDMFGEFFLVQNRYPLGNDIGIPGEGLIIWHVDAQLDDGSSFKYNNRFTEHKLLRLMEADGLEEVENTKAQVDSGDFYTERNSFGLDTKPSSKSYDGGDSRVRIYNISQTGETMSATFEIVAPSTQNGLSMVFGAIHFDGSKWSGTENWTSSYNKTRQHYEISIEDINYDNLGYTTTVTPIGVAGHCSTNDSNGKLLISCYDKQGNTMQVGFSFIILKE